MRALTMCLYGRGLRFLQPPALLSAARRSKSTFFIKHFGKTAFIQYLKWLFSVKYYPKFQSLLHIITVLWLIESFKSFKWNHEKYRIALSSSLFQIFFMLIIKMLTYWSITLFLMWFFSPLYRKTITHTKGMSESESISLSTYRL